MKKNDMKLDFHDLRLKPAKISYIEHRATINPYYKVERPPYLRAKAEFLRIFTAPMDTVIDGKNAYKFLKNRIHAIMPRGESFVGSGTDTFFRAMGLDEFIKEFLEIDLLNLSINKAVDDKYHILIDIANGHMAKLHDTVKKAKDLYGKHMVIMAGNVANPETFKILSKAGADYIRIGIGNGCFTGDMKIITASGRKKIVNIEVGEKVLTHTGEFKSVLNVKKIPYDGELIKINDNITCTPDHEFYVLNKKYLNFINDENVDNLCEWVSAMEFSKNSNYLLIEHNNIIKDD